MTTSRFLFREQRKQSRISRAEEIFQRHFEINEWGSNESVSGPGSTANYTENIRKELPRLCSELGVQTMLDAPCGDFNWFRLIEWDTPITYTGGDIVQPLVERNQAMYGDSRSTFLKLNIVYDELPRVDLWLCRDCLFHLSNRDILLVVANFLRSDIGYLLTSIHSDCAANSDIQTGAFRLLNLQLPPFCFSKPLKRLDDWIDGFPVRHLALWDRETLMNCLASNRTLQRVLLTLGRRGYALNVPSLEK